MSENAPSGPRRGPASDSLETAYRRWDEVRARTALDEASGGGLRGGLGFAGRTAARIRNLGIAWDLQRDLYRGLVDRVTELQQRLESLEEKGGLTVRVDAAEAEIRRLAASEADVRGAINAMMERSPDAGGGDRGELANLRDRQESLRVRQARLEAEIADLKERAGAPAIGGVAVPLSPRDLAEILAAVEKERLGGERPEAVEVSIQDVRAEDLLLAARRHFGGRLSSSGPSYRSPNDLWLHVDFSAHWSRPILLENAVARLAPGGRFLLVTATGTGDPPRHPGLALCGDRELPLASGGPVRLLGWEKTGS